MLAVTPSFLRATFLKTGTVAAKLGDDARCMLSCSSCPVSADEVMGSSSHGKLEHTTASLLGFPSAAEWERTALSSAFQ